MRKRDSDGICEVLRLRCEVVPTLDRRNVWSQALNYCRIYTRSEDTHAGEANLIKSHKILTRAKHFSDCIETISAGLAGRL